VRVVNSCLGGFDSHMLPPKIMGLMRICSASTPFLRKEVYIMADKKRLSHMSAHAG